MALSVDSVPRLWRLARLDYDPVRQRRILLYPEGAVLLNDTGAAVLELGGLGFAYRNHSLRPPNLQGRDVMLSFDCSETTSGLTNAFGKLSLFQLPNPLPTELLGPVLQLEFKRPRLFRNCGDRFHKTLSNSLFQPKSFDLARHLNSRSRQLPFQPQ